MWTGYTKAHCATCHTTFGSVNSFTRHRTGGECAHPRTLGLFWSPFRHCWSETYRNPPPRVRVSDRDSEWAQQERDAARGDEITTDGP